ncbi:very short patch repair protein [Gordonia aichiensis NBRC 108223]|uniref:Very short patch repair protein n=2 Tax=Gordonia aichiensis TaxID=36820 RepID=L7KT34_9ACTN|nr:very short patch repair protein [Gordonia aichiensis NBRC 108223]
MPGRPVAMSTDRKAFYAGSMTESWASTPARRRNMQANRHRDTQPELLVRRLLHARGLRYRVDVRPVPELRRRADIVFTRQLVAVFIDGCFWHGCPDHGSREFHTNANYWSAKIARNVNRDADTTARLIATGWKVLRFWEHSSPTEVADEIERAVRDAR